MLFSGNDNVQVESHSGQRSHNMIYLLMVQQDLQFFLELMSTWEYIKCYLHLCFVIAYDFTILISNYILKSTMA